MVYSSEEEETQYTRAIQKVTSSELLTKQAMRKNVLYTKKKM
jgi:hypothetical protein